MSSFFRKLVRKKYVDPSSITDTKLSRCLTTLDLTALGMNTHSISCVHNKYMLPVSVYLNEVISKVSTINTKVSYTIRCKSYVMLDFPTAPNPEVIIGWLVYYLCNLKYIPTFCHVIHTENWTSSSWLLPNLSVVITLIARDREYLRSWYLCCGWSGSQRHSGPSCHPVLPYSSFSISVSRYCAIRVVTQL